MSLDARLTPARDGKTSLMLEGVVRARAFIAPKAMVARAPTVAIRKSPDAQAEQVDQLLFGEAFDVLDESAGFAWGQAHRDGYVGYVEAASLAPALEPATHTVAAIRTYAFKDPDIKSAPVGLYSLNALVSVETRQGRFAKAHGSGWFVETHLAPIGRFQADLAAVAERFLGAPYQWGGRESVGLDCSGLVQQAMFALGQACPRDTDQQTGLGCAVDPLDLQRGDLVFWRGHVAIMLDQRQVIHANAHHMAVAVEPLAEALSRIAAAGYGEPTAYRRPSI